MYREEYVLQGKFFDSVIAYNVHVQRTQCHAVLQGKFFESVIAYNVHVQRHNVTQYGSVYSIYSYNEKA